MAEACLDCGEPVHAAEADVTDAGLRCWRCSTRGSLPRRELPAWQRWAMVAVVAAFGLGAVAAIVVMVTRGELMWAVLDLPLVLGALYVLVWREAEGGIVLAGAEAVVMATVGVQSGTVLPLVGVLVAVGAMALGRRALPLLSP